MTTASFDTALAALNARMDRRINVPRGRAQWRIDYEDVPVVVVKLDAQCLGLNLQNDAAAAPCFAFCIAWWLEHFQMLGSKSVRARVEVIGDVPRTAHGNRSLFLLHEMERLLAGRFTCTPRQSVPWPTAPIVNSSEAEREVLPGGGELQTEHELECAFVSRRELVEQFLPIDDIDRFRRQLPAGVFDGKVAKDSRWSPGAKSQVDLWALSKDQKTLHLFELKKPGNAALGILPEALWYALVLNALRTNNFNGTAVGGVGAAVASVRTASRIVMWMLATDVHPLLRYEDHSPLESFRFVARIGAGPRNPAVRKSRERPSPAPRVAVACPVPQRTTARLRPRRPAFPQRITGWLAGAMPEASGTGGRPGSRVPWPAIGGPADCHARSSCLKISAKT